MLIDGEDGVTHINIYSKGKTNLGKWLSNFTYAPISTEHGWFNSIEGYWYWLTTANDRLRNLSGHEAKKLGEESEVLVKLDSEIFITKIKRALDLKLKSDKPALSEFALSTLPFCHYYEYGGKRVDAGYDWIIEHFEDRRKLMKEYYTKINGKIRD